MNDMLAESRVRCMIRRSRYVVWNNGEIDLGSGYAGGRRGCGEVIYSAVVKCVGRW